MATPDTAPGRGHGRYGHNGDRETTNGGSARNTPERADTRRVHQKNNLRGNGSRPNQRGSRA